MLNDYPYEASDEASESELLERSLSVWKGPCYVETENFDPIPFDLHTAASLGNYDAVHAYITRQESDSNLNRKNKGGWTALMYASYIGHDNVVNLLLDAGVDVNLKNNSGCTPLMLAASCGNESVGFFLLQFGAILEARDSKGRTALFHATSSGHQNFVKFLLENSIDANAVEPHHGMTPFILAALEGHEIIVQYFLQHGVDVNARTTVGDTARSLALLNHHTKVVTLIDRYEHGNSPLRNETGLHCGPADLSSSEEGYRLQQHYKPPRHSPRSGKSKSKAGPSVRDGPEAVQQLIEKSRQHKGAPAQQGAWPSPGQPLQVPTFVPSDYVTFQNDQIVTASQAYTERRLPHSAGDGGKEDGENGVSAFLQTGAVTIKSSSSSSGGFAAAVGIPSGDSLSEQESPAKLTTRDLTGYVPTPPSPAPTLPTPAKEPVPPDDKESRQEQQQQQQQQLDHHHHQQQQQRHRQQQQHHHHQQQQQPHHQQEQQQHHHQQEQQQQHHHHQQQQQQHHHQQEQQQHHHHQQQQQQHHHQQEQQQQQHHHQQEHRQQQEQEQQQQDLEAFLRQVGLSKYHGVLVEQDIDLQLFLTLTENDLKEVGIQLFGPRRKMTSAIARWHSNAPLSTNAPEQAYADKLEAEMQEMAIQLHQVCAQLESMKQQVLQERELRSVVEGCLMEDRAAWQRLQHTSSEASSVCCNMTAAMINMRLCQAELMKQLTPDLDSDRRCTKLNNTVEARDRRPADGMGASPEHKAAPLYTWGAQQAGEDASADAQQQLWGASVQAQQQLGGASAHALTLRLCKHAEELERHLSVISSLVEMMRQQSGDHVQTPALQQQNA